MWDKKVYATEAESDLMVTPGRGWFGEGTQTNVSVGVNV